MKTVVCIGTGPSLTPAQVDTARDKGFELYVANNAIFLAEDAALLYACNYEWWKHYHTLVRYLPCEKWTQSERAASHFEGLKWIRETDNPAEPGLSTDKNIIHPGHGSGYSLVSMAYRGGADRIILLGYDMKYAPDYDGVARRVGSTDRHVFGEYPEVMQHWPSAQVNGGIHVEMVELYRSIHTQGLVEVINCTPDSAIDCFDLVDIKDIE